MLRNDDCAAENLLDYLHYQNYYILIDIHLSGQTNTSIPQQINFAGKLEEDKKVRGATMFLITEK